MDLRIAHCEITQGIQVHGNTVPLVEGKPTVVRVIPRTDATQPIPGVTAKLYAVRPDGTQLGPIDPRNGPIDVTDQNWRGDPDGGLDFLLEPAWCEGSMDFRAELEPPVGLPASPGQASIVSATFYPRRPLRLRYVLVIHDAHPPDKGLDDIHVCDFLRAVFPMNPLDLSYEPASTPTLTFDDKVDGYIDDAGLIEQLSMIELGNPSVDAVYGWTAQAVFPYNGRSDPRYLGGQGRVAFGTDEGLRRRRTLAHELGHNACIDGLYHPPEDTDSLYWYPGQLQDDEIGYDAMGLYPTQDAVRQTFTTTGGDEASLYDVMAPERMEEEAWIGPHNYRMLFDALESVASATVGAPVSPAAGTGTDNPFDAADSTAAPPPGAGEPFVHVLGGVLRRDGGGRLSFPRPIPRLPKHEEMLSWTPLGSAMAELRFYRLDGGEYWEMRELRIGWQPRFKDAENNPVDAWFSWVVAEIPDRVVRIALVGNGNLIHRVDRTKGETVDIPREDVVVKADDDKKGLTLSWTAKQNNPGHSHHRQPRLYQQLYYRSKSATDPEGKNWHVIATGITEAHPSLSMPVTRMPGGVGGDLMILASSGYAADKLKVPILRLQLVPPKDHPRIVAPAPGKRLRAGEHFWLIGYALDAAGQRVDEGRLHWSLELGGGGGLIGRGEQVVHRKPIPVGTHTIRLSVDKGEDTTVTINVTD